MPGQCTSNAYLPSVQCYTAGKHLQRSWTQSLGSDARECMLVPPVNSANVCCGFRWVLLRLGTTCRKALVNLSTWRLDGPGACGDLHQQEGDYLFQHLTC